MFLGDFHVHSNFSDGALSIPELVDMYGQRGFGALAITDHVCEKQSFLGRSAHLLGKTLTRATFPQYLRLLAQEAARAWERYKMVVIPGVEITKNSLINHRSAHVVALGVTEWIPPELGVEEVVQAIRAQGALSIAAHPVWTGRIEPQTYHIWSRRDEWSTLFDAWEVASGARLFPEVVKTRLPKVASSDLHHPRQLESWKTQLLCPRHPEAILHAIRRQELDFVFYREPSPVARTAPTSWAPLAVPLR
jgi:hypothetical protein